MKKMMKSVTIASLVFLLGACGASSSGGHYDSYATESVNSAYDYEAGYGVAESAAYDGGYSYDEKTESTTTAGREDSSVTGQKLVYTGSLSIETLNYPETVQAVRERISAYQGIIQDQNEWDGDNSWYYTDGRGRTSNRSLSMTVRIPTKDFDRFMTDMDGTGKVTSRSQNVENISRKYSDNSIEIEALEKQQQRLLEMMDSAKTVEEMIMVEERLSEVQAELNQKKSWQSSMDTDVEYSTIYLNIKEVQKYTPTTEPGIQISGFWERLKDTAEYSGKYFIYFLQNLVLFLIRILPFALLILVIYLCVRKYRKSKGLDPNIFHVKKKEPRDWKKYAAEKKEQLDAKNDAMKIEAELKKDEPKQ